MVASGTNDASQTELAIVEKEIEKASKPKKQYNKDISEVIEKEVGRYALIHGTKAASACFNDKYSKYTFVRTSIDNCNKKMGSKSNQMPFKKKGRPNLLNHNLFKKVKDVMLGARAAGAVISRRFVIAIGKDVVKDKNTTPWMETGGPLELTKDWARGVLKSLEWTKQKETTGKVEPSKQILEEKKNFRRKF